MTLTREWLPVSNYTYGGGHFVGVLHTTQGFTGPNGMYDLQHYFAGDVGASSHVGIDAFHPGRIVEMVSRANSAWTQCNRNYDCISAEQCGMAEWSRDMWLNSKGPLLENTAQWMREESDHFGIPLVKLTASQAQSGSSGWCNHSDLGSYGCGHSDCGPGYPWDVVLSMALGGGPTRPPATEEGEDEMNTVMVPPGPVPVEVSFDGTPFKTLSFYGDATTYPDGERGIIRCAFFKEGSTNSHVVQTVYVESGRNKPVIQVPAGAGGVSLVREDNLNVTYYPNFGK